MVAQLIAQREKDAPARCAGIQALPVFHGTVTISDASITSAAVSKPFNARLTRDASSSCALYGQDVRPMLTGEIPKKSLDGRLFAPIIAASPFFQHKPFYSKRCCISF